jgi:hypothetical protein
MTSTRGIANTNLGMEPYTSITEPTDVVFVEDNNNYVALIDDNLSYLEESIPIDSSNLRIGVSTSPYKIEDGDYTTQIYFGAISVIGLFILFRMIQKSRG